MTTDLFSIPVATLESKPANLAPYKGKVLLIVNVASKCGLTPQYEGLEKLYQEKHGQGLEILGFPANNFGNQEPGDNTEIQQFCSLTYGVNFPMFSKISVNGADRHPLYQALIDAQPKAERTEAFREKLAGHGLAPASDADVLWNFEKFVVDRHGKVVGRFSPDLTAEDVALRTTIDRALAA